MNIFVGNLPFQTTEVDLRSLFASFGDVASVIIVARKEIKAFKSRGFGFIEMPDGPAALTAITQLNRKEFMGRVIDVNRSRPKTKAQRKCELMKIKQRKAMIKARKHKKKELEKEKKRVIPVLNSPGAYKGGRRTKSYIKRKL